MVWKEYHNGIHFSTMSDFYISMYLSITNLDMFRLGYIFAHSIG